MDMGVHGDSGGKKLSSNLKVRVSGEELKGRNTELAFDDPNLH